MFAQILKEPVARNKKEHGGKCPKYKKCLEKITLVSDCVTTCFLNCDCDGRVFFLSFVSQYHTVFTYRHMEVPNLFSATELLLVQKHYKIKCCT